MLDQLSFSKNCKKELSLNMPSSHGGEEEVYLYPCPTPTLDEVGWPTSRSGHFTADKGARYTSCRRLGEPRGRSGWVRKISPTGVRILNRPARSEWLQRLRYTGLQ